MASFTKVASGSIAMNRFVKLDTTADGKVLQCGAGEKVYGISHQSSRRAPFSSLDDGFAAIAGEGLMIYGPGNNSKCGLELGGTVAAGDRLKSDANGKGVATVTNLDEYGALAMSAGVSGEVIEVELRTGMMST